MADPRKPDLRSRVLAQVAEAPAVTRATHRKRRILAAGVAALAVLAVMDLHELDGLRARPAPYVLVVLVSFGSLAIALVGRASRAMSSPLPRDAGGLAGLARRAPVLWAAGALMASAVAPSTWAEAFVAQPLAESRCFTITLSCALVLVAAVAVLYRGSLVRDAGPVALGVCAAAGALASFAISFACTLAGLGHVLLGHVLPVALLTMLLAPVLARVLRMPSPP